MKKYTIVLILAYGYFLSSHAQQSCKDCIYDLYKLLGTCQSKCIDIGNNTYSVKSLYQDKSDSIIFAGTSSELCHLLHFFRSMRNADGQTGAVFLLVKSGWARCPA